MLRNGSTSLSKSCAATPFGSACASFSRYSKSSSLIDRFLELLEGSAARVDLGADSLVHLVLYVSPKGRPGVGRRWQMTMDKIIINTFTIWQMAMGKISTFAMNNFTFPSFAAPNTSSATSCVKLFSCVLHVPPKGRRGGTRVLSGPSLRCSKAQHVLRPILRGAWVPPHEDEHLQQ